jgi:hypothetical protein
MHGAARGCGRGAALFYVAEFEARVGESGERRPRGARVISSAPIRGPARLTSAWGGAIARALPQRRNWPRKRRFAVGRARAARRCRQQRGGRGRGHI